MTRIDSLLREGTTISFEFFPPKDEHSRAQLQETLRELEPLHPSFVSITYGAGGSTRQYTHDLVFDILEHSALNPMAHLSCVAHSRTELEDIVREYGQGGIENILALSGDLPEGMTFDQVEVKFASDLVALIRDVGDFCVGVAAHPEVHPRSPDRATDRKRLAEKLAIADFAITQFFFNADVYVRLIEEMAALGVTKPIIPGIMPVTNVNQVERFAKLSGAAFPEDFAAELHAAATPDDVRNIGVARATELCQALLDAGAPGLHFYTLNRSTATQQIWQNLCIE